MLTHFGLDSIEGEWQESLVCIGTFDGVHLGHQEVIRAGVCRARVHGLPCVLLTFDRHPASIIAPSKKPPEIQDLSGKLSTFANLGVDVSVVLSFDNAMSKTSAHKFFDEILIGKLKADLVVVGHDFAFGHNRAGDAIWLKKRIETDVIPAFEIEGRRVSSSEIRRFILAGDVESAAKLLGRDFDLSGVVVGGEKLGRTLGYPTINLARSGDVIVPGDGVYAGSCKTPYGDFKAAISVGMRPAVGGKNRSVEAFLIDYPGKSLYGRAVALSFSSRLRDERDFASLDDLKKQIALDVEQASLVSTSRII